MPKTRNQKNDIPMAYQSEEYQKVKEQIQRARKKLQKVKQKIKKDREDRYKVLGCLIEQCLTCEEIARLLGQAEQGNPEIYEKFYKKYLNKGGVNVADFSKSLDDNSQTSQPPFDDTPP